MSNNLWFRKKTFGWGWTPCTWQGWAVVGIYLASVFLTVWFVKTGVLVLNPTQLTIVLILESAGLIAVSYAKGETPSWSWGRNS